MTKHNSLDLIVFSLSSARHEYQVVNHRSYLSVQVQSCISVVLYQDRWIPLIGDQLVYRREDNNACYWFAIKLRWDFRIYYQKEIISLENFTIANQSMKPVKFFHFEQFLIYGSSSINVRTINSTLKFVQISVAKIFQLNDLSQCWLWVHTYIAIFYNFKINSMRCFLELTYLWKFLVI